MLSFTRGFHYGRRRYFTASAMLGLARLFFII